MFNKYEITIHKDGGLLTTYRMAESLEELRYIVEDEFPGSELTESHLVNEGDPDKWRKQEIGCINLGVDGSDQYFLITNPEDDLDVELTREIFLRAYYSNDPAPGGYFCVRVSVYETDHDNQLIVVVHHRYDV